MQKSTTRTAEQIILELEQAGFKAAFLPISAMEQIKAHYKSMPERGPDTRWLRKCIEHFWDHQPPELDFELRSILVAALPCAGATLLLKKKGRAAKIAIPPGYINVSSKQARFEETLTHAAQGYAFKQAKHGISQKLLAALSGLGKYGRNNICYVGDWGSWCWLETRYTDIPYDGPVYADLLMEACGSCGICRKACPTGAIGEHQVIDAGRCLTGQNEGRGLMPLWVPGDAHHTITGCLRCQECCPQNPPMDFSNTLALDEDETRRLLSRKSKLPKDLEMKFLAFGCEKWTLGAYKRNARLAVKSQNWSDIC